MHRGWIANKTAEDTCENQVCAKSGAIPRNPEVCMTMNLLLIPNCWSVIVLSYNNNYSVQFFVQLLVQLCLASMPEIT
jgi:hypothetical protein